jgi:hypothetical protein
LWFIGIFVVDELGVSGSSVIDWQPSKAAGVEPACRASRCFIAHLRHIAVFTRQQLVVTLAGSSLGTTLIATLHVDLPFEMSSAA